MPGSPCPSPPPLPLRRSQLAPPHEGAVFMDKELGWRECRSLGIQRAFPASSDPHSNPLGFPPDRERNWGSEESSGLPRFAH